MKPLTLCFLFLPLVLRSEWIEPPARSAKGYLVPTPDYSPVFPRDHGAHRGHGIEWWYWIGHLKETSGDRQFGFQSTVFRLAGDPDKSSKPEKGNFGSRQLYLAHSALSDLREKTYLHHERVLREGWQAKVSSRELAIQVAGIEVRTLEGEDGHRVVSRLPEEGRLELEMRPVKPLVVFGDRGLSRKGGSPASVSWYWTYTRLEAKGTLRYKGEEIAVRGTAWMDHEISSSQLGENLAGWDWTCIQLDDGTELKAYRLRQKDGGSDPWSAVYWIDRKGRATRVYAKDFTWNEEANWTSPDTGLSYPTSVRIEATHPTQGKLVYRIRPLIDNQEFRGNGQGNDYWEGACEALDGTGKKIGKAYLELAGYGGTLGARLN